MEMDPELDAKKEYYFQPQDAIASDIDSIPLMPVELAIKRELAYRRKVEMLRLQQRTDFKKSPMRSQHLIGKEHAACLQAIEDAKRVREKDGEAAKVKWEELEWEMVP
ncbi:hypothetical protein HHK36_024284 [Tetracentron sinense]|uniref:Uncharacterized protein n=1 Tax=Tetracentron sinense TaxID=13715 RepID=A0A834YKL1_TETSI|nr:hypothetical protein HHK36_024284 [Tetracentron sinense]